MIIKQYFSGQSFLPTASHFQHPTQECGTLAPREPVTPSPTHLPLPTLVKNSASPAVNSSIQPAPSGFFCCLHPCSTRRTARARTSVSHSVILHGFLSFYPTLAQGCITCFPLTISLEPVF